MPETSPREGAPEPRGAANPSRLDRVRAVALPIVIAAAIFVFGRIVHGHYPIQQWLFWRYAGYWLLSAAWAGACVSSGHAVLKRLLGRTLPLLEHAVVSFAVGLYVFFLAMLLGGLLGLYGTAFFVLLPSLMLGAGTRPVVRTARRFLRHRRFARARALPDSSWALPITLFGLLGAGMVYFSILTPNNVAFDSRWQHLPIAEHYVAEGAVRRFPEGWYIGASPHLSSFVYTWAFMLPKSTLFDRVELSAHLEFVSFLWTLAGIPALVRLLVPSLRKAAKPGGPRSLVGFSWAARFLFPGIFLYDSSLCVGADHMTAVFAVPIYALLVRAYRDLSPHLCLVLVMMLSGAFLTKYTGALTLLSLPVLAIAARTAWIGLGTLIRRVRARRALVLPREPISWWKGPLTAFVGGLLFTAPQWAKNWVFYGDPLYPLLANRLHAHPWTPDSAERFEWGFIKAELWKPTPDLAGVWQTLKALITQSFIPNDWPRFHGSVPVFGSLFTLTLFFLPFLRKTWRIAGLFLAVHLGIFCWYWTHHQDRYLQAMLPWFAVATAGVLMLVWRTHVVNRVAVAGLVALQVVWGADVYFISGHAMIGSPITAVTALISSGYRKDEKSREAGLFAPFPEIARALPKHAKVLVHQMHPHLGLEAMSVNDFTVNQGGISYGRLLTSRAVYDLYRGYGVTHLLYSTGVSGDAETFAGDLVFWSFARRYGQNPKAFSGMTLAAMPDAPPPEETSDVVAMLMCPAGPASGLYHLPQLHVPAFGPKKGKYPRPYKAAAAGGVDDADLVTSAAYAVVEPRCRAFPAAVTGFDRVVKRNAYDFWVRLAKVPPS